MIRFKISTFHQLGGSKAIVVPADFMRHMIDERKSYWIEIKEATDDEATKN